MGFSGSGALGLGVLTQIRPEAFQPVSNNVKVFGQDPLVSGSFVWGLKLKSIVVE